MPLHIFLDGISNLLMFKETSGYISGKSGLAVEEKYLRLFFQQGHIAVLNDITNSLRFGDVTVVGEGVPPVIVEIKSSNNRSDRVERQSQKADELVDYLNTGQTKKGQMSIHRRRSITDFRDHVEELNNLLDLAVSGGHVFAKIEEGLFYYIETNENESDLALIIKSNIPNPPITYHLNSLKYSCTGYSPFALSICRPESLFNFYRGCSLYSYS